MLYINVRQLLNNLEESTSKLPVTVTKYGRPIFEIWAVGGNNSQEKARYTDVTQDVYNDVNRVQTEAVLDVKCEVPFCKNPAVGVGKMFDETSGDMRDIQLCASHLKRSLRES